VRYENIELNLSTAACDVLLRMLEDKLEHRHKTMLNGPGAELRNLENELRARLQRTDQDPHATIPTPTGDWINE
jgi:hypothetical protein